MSKRKPKTRVGHLDRPFSRRDAVRSKRGDRSNPMSAIVLQFPLAHTEESNVLDGSVDVSPVDRRGFVILDACVSPVLGIQLMTLLGSYERKSTLPCPNASILRHDR